MKRVLLLLAAGSLALSASVTTTKHNLSSTGTAKATDYTQVCKFCHHPHGAQVGNAQIIPLWGHMTSTAAQSFPVYSSDTIKGTVSGLINDKTSGPTLACLSCHDGTVAVNARFTYVDAAPGVTNRGTYGNIDAAQVSGATFNITTDQQGRRLGTLVNAKNDLTSLHPVNVEYNTVKNPELVPAATAVAAGVRLFNGGTTVHCASCHEPHGSANSMFLRVTSTGSALCLACHNK